MATSTNSSFEPMEKSKDGEKQRDRRLLVGSRMKRDSVEVGKLYTPSPGNILKAGIFLEYPG
jgi:hypothetical protein